MSVATTTNPPVMTIWGTDGEGEVSCGAFGDKACTTPMGNTADNAITFDQIRTFAKFAYGECAIEGSTAGAFIFVSQFNIGSSTASTTYVKTSSESVDFGFQTTVYPQATFIAGQLSATGTPYA